MKKGIKKVIAETGAGQHGVVLATATMMTKGKPGVMHSFKSYMLQDKAGEPVPEHAIAYAMKLA